MIDWPKVVGWGAALVICAAFWFCVGYGIAHADGPTTAPAPASPKAVPAAKFHRAVSGWRAARAVVRVAARVSDPPWRPCGWCWGQREFWTLDGDRIVGPVQCPRCLGVGEQPAVAS